MGAGQVFGGRRRMKEKPSRAGVCTRGKRPVVFLAVRTFAMKEGKDAERRLPNGLHAELTQRSPTTEWTNGWRGGGELKKRRSAGKSPRDGVGKGKG